MDGDKKTAAKRKMTEREIQAKAVEILEREGWHYWFPPEMYFSYRGKVVVRDIFSIFDIIAIRQSKIKFIQLTTIQHLSDHRRKINDYCLLHNVRFGAGYIWAWDKRVNRFKIEKTC